MDTPIMQWNQGPRRIILQVHSTYRPVLWVSTMVNTAHLFHDDVARSQSHTISTKVGTPELFARISVIYLYLAR